MVELSLLKGVPLFNALVCGEHETYAYEIWCQETDIILSYVACDIYVT